MVHDPLVQRRTIQIIAIVGFLSIVSLFAVEKKPEVIMNMTLEDLMNIEVTTSSKKLQKMSEAPTNITVISAQQIKEWGCRDIKDALKRIAGFPIIPDRDEMVFAVRGNVSDNNQKYLMLIDGHRMNSIENFGPGQIIEMPNNLSSVKRIEVIRGPGSAVWGPDALAGVINIISKTPEDLGNSTVNFTVAPGAGFGEKSDGSDTYPYSGVVDFQAGKRISDNVAIMFMGSGGMSSGEIVQQAKSSDFPRATNTKIPISGTVRDSAVVPGTYKTVLDKHRPGYMLQAKANVGDFSINSFAFSTETFNRHYEWGTRENYLTTYKSFMEGMYQKKITEGLQLELKMSSDLNRAEYQPFKDVDDESQMVNIVWLDRRYNTSLDMNAELDKRVVWACGIDYSYGKAGSNQRIDNFNVNVPADTAKNRASIKGYWFDPLLEDNQVGGYLSGTLTPINQISLVLGGRFDYNEERGSDPFNVNPRVAIMYFPLENTSIKALYNRGYLRPANFQSGYKKDSVKSESMDQVDLVWMQQVAHLSFSVTGFWQRLCGFINLFPGGSYNYRNTADYSSKGLEIDAAYALASHDVWANFYYTKATAENFSKSLAYNNRRVNLDNALLCYPPFIVNAGATLRFLDTRVFASPNLRIVGQTPYRTASVAMDTLDRAAFYDETSLMTYLNVSIGYDFQRYASISVYFDNILNVTDPVPMTVWNGTIGQTGFEVAGKIQFQF